MRQKNVCFCWGILGDGWSIDRLNFQVGWGNMPVIALATFFPPFSLFFSIQN